jgi:hypothetical protein
MTPQNAVPAPMRQAKLTLEVPLPNQMPGPRSKKNQGATFSLASCLGTHPNREHGAPPQLFVCFDAVVALIHLGGPSDTEPPMSNVQHDRLIGYARVSTQEQECSPQYDALIAHGVTKQHCTATSACKGTRTQNQELIRFTRLSRERAKPVVAELIVQLRPY